MRNSGRAVSDCHKYSPATNAWTRSGHVFYVRADTAFDYDPDNPLWGVVLNGGRYHLSNSQVQTAIDYSFEQVRDRWVLQDDLLEP